MIIKKRRVTNFNNGVINDIATGKAWALNLLHSVFAVGAFTTPLITLFFTPNNPGNCKYATLTWAFFSFMELVVFFFSKVPNNNPLPKEKRQMSLAFLKDKNYLTVCLILFFYLCTEQGINGWLVTYFKDSGIMSGTFAQSMASLLWLVILLGRLACAYLSEKVAKSELLVYSGIGFK